MELEGVIEQGLKTFYEVGKALLDIRDARLYRATHGTFEDYCQDRWGIQRRHAYKLISGFEVYADIEDYAENVPNWAQNDDAQIPLPTNEAQTRPLAKLPPEERGPAWEEVVERSDGNPTGKVSGSLLF